MNLDFNHLFVTLTIGKKEQRRTCRLNCQRPDTARDRLRNPSAAERKGRRLIRARRLHFLSLLYAEVQFLQLRLGCWFHGHPRSVPSGSS